MKKLLSLFICVLLMVSMVFILTSCGEPDAEPTIVGKWTATVDVDELITEGMGQSMGDAAQFFEFKNLSLVMNAEFTADSKVTMKVDEASIDSLFDELKKCIKNGMEGYLNDLLQKSGANMTLEQYLAQTNQTIDSLVDAAMSQVPRDSLELDMTGTYKIEGNKIALAEDGEDFDEYNEFELTSNTLTVDTGDDMGILEFTKVK